MAQNYCESSSLIKIPNDKFNEAIDIVSRIDTDLEESEDGYVGYEAEVESDGIWIYHKDEGNFNPDHAEKLVRALVEDLQLSDTIVCSWSYTCSKPRVDEFGGGAFAVKRGKLTFWIDARNAAEQMEST